MLLIFGSFYKKYYRGSSESAKNGWGGHMMLTDVLNHGRLKNVTIAHHTKGNTSEISVAVLVRFLISSWFFPNLGHMFWSKRSF